MSDGLGSTAGGGKNTAADIVSAMAQSGDTLPQVTDGGMITGTWHTVTSDGAGPIAAVLDPTGTGAFASGVMLKTVTQIPGKNGNIRPQKRSLWDRAVSTISKRAVNINTDEVSHWIIFPIIIEIIIANSFFHSQWPSKCPPVPPALAPWPDRRTSAL